MDSREINIALYVDDTIYVEKLKLTSSIFNRRILTTLKHGHGRRNFIWDKWNEARIKWEDPGNLG